jgi:hypothetical protein
MNCRVFEAIVSDLAREQMMEANARGEALVHSGGCKACALRLSLERRLTLELRDLVAQMESDSASARVEERLLEAFRTQKSLLPHSRLANRNRYWPVAAAAVVLIAFGIVGMRWRLDGPSLTATETAIETSDNTGATGTPKPSPVVVAQPNVRSTSRQTVALHRPGPKHSVRRSQKGSSGSNGTSLAGSRAAERNTTEAGSGESEVTTQFLPLSYTSLVNWQDGAQLVRVEMPRSAMVSFGLPVNMERYGEKVTADVLVSADGLARAIRFVQNASLNQRNN